MEDIPNSGKLAANGSIDLGVTGEELNSPSRRIALTVEYDGTNYKGFQLQVNQPTIQGEIESSLINFVGEHIRVRGASRTDSGAHATGQVVDFVTASCHPVEIFPRALNFYLPRDIQIQKANVVPHNFNSRRDATSRIYRYNILNREWPSPLLRGTHFWVREALQVSKMASAARRLLGVHDFRPICSGHPVDKSAIRRVFRWDVWRENDNIIIECEANGFLRHQIRRANASLVEAGKDRCHESIVADVLSGIQPENIGSDSLPALGLCLMRVDYLGFGPDAELSTRYIHRRPRSQKAAGIAVDAN